MATETNNIGRQVIPFTIVDNAGLSSPMFVYLYGTTNPDKPQGNTYYLSNLKTGDCTKFQPNKPAQGYGLGPYGGTQEGKFPQLDGIRIYISYFHQLQVPTNSDGIPQAPSADNAGPNFELIWDFVEATWHVYTKDRSVLHVNTTQVDAFGLAFKVEHSGYDPAKPERRITIVNGFDSNTARRAIFDEITQEGPPWSKLIVAGGRRVLMPLKAMDKGLFPKNQLDDYIAKVVKFYQKDNKLVFNYQNVDYVGTTDSNGNFVFVGGGKKYSIPKPTTRQCYAQDIRANPNDGVSAAICAALGASFLRSTLMFYDEFPVPQNLRRYFYREPPVCQYARVIHGQGIDYHAFCYGYDEVAGDAGTNRDVVNPTSIKLTINKA